MGPSIIAYNRETFTRLWQISMSDPVRLLFSGRGVTYGASGWDDQPWQIWACDEDGKLLWRVQLPDNDSDPELRDLICEDGILYAAAWDGILALDASNGAHLW